MAGATLDQLAARYQILSNSVAYTPQLRLIQFNSWELMNSTGGPTVNSFCRD
jgi:hypothetical protein